MGPCSVAVLLGAALLLLAPGGPQVSPQLSVAWGRAQGCPSPCPSLLQALGGLRRDADVEQNLAKET